MHKYLHMEKWQGVLSACWEMKEEGGGAGRPKGKNIYFKNI